MVALVAVASHCSAEHARHLLLRLVGYPLNTLVLHHSNQPAELMAPKCLAELTTSTRQAVLVASRQGERFFRLCLFIERAMVSFFVCYLRDCNVVYVDPTDEVGGNFPQQGHVVVVLRGFSAGLLKLEENCHNRVTVLFCPSINLTKVLCAFRPFDVHGAQQGHY